MADLPIVPGRGLNTHSGVKQRLEYLKELGKSLEHTQEHDLDLHNIHRNIESFTGSVELPLGLVGPLKYLHNNTEELVYGLAGTLEGALVYSMNRGAWVISKSGGFQARVHHQRMLRAPAFILTNKDSAKLLVKWVEENITQIREVAESYSNHASLLSIEPELDGTTAHFRFYYATGDCAGQNMSTICTWHAINFIADEFEKTHPKAILDFVVEGNGASDKKVSAFNISHGRGVKVSASCEIPELILNEVLRTNSDQFMKFYEPSRRLAEKDGMTGYNINVANALAAIFVATGQDLASLAESSPATLELEKTTTGLKLELTLTNLVVGTVGGGTHLPRQAEALELMGCRGNGKLERFASLIAGFALGLEISTFAAIVSGEFAKSHEKLGRNKPVNWLTKSEIDLNFLKKALSSPKAPAVEFSEWLDKEEIDQGTLTQITKKVTRKLCGHYVVRVNDQPNGLVLIKSKPLSREVIEGLHRVAASVDRKLSDLLYAYHQHTEYHQTHHKELWVNELLDKERFRSRPEHFGNMVDEQREIHLLLTEYLPAGEMKILNSENEPQKWSDKDIINCIRAIHAFHKIDPDSEAIDRIPLQQPWQAAPLYQRFLEIMTDTLRNNRSELDIDWLSKLDPNDLKTEFQALGGPVCLVHNDFNPRNIMIAENDQVYIYDWELCMRDVPQRDIAELMCFTLLPDTPLKRIDQLLRFHYCLGKFDRWEDYLQALHYALRSLIITRFSFYEVSGIVEAFPFSRRVLATAIELCKYIEKDMLTLVEGDFQRKDS